MLAIQCKHGDSVRPAKCSVQPLRLSFCFDCSVVIENQVAGLANGQDSYVDYAPRAGATNLRGQTFWTGPVALTGNNLRLTSLSINIKASTSPVTITLSIYKFPTNQYHPLANDVPIFTNGPTSYALTDPFNLDPSLGTYQPLT